MQFMLEPGRMGHLGVRTKSWTAIRHLAYIQKITNLNSLQTAAIGDGENDLSMFTVSDTKIAMGNAMVTVKDNADYIADDNANDGVGTWIDKNLL